MSLNNIKKGLLILLCAAAVSLGTACAELNKPASDPFYGNTAPPPAGEFRWANGELPKTFDPAFAKSPSETQAVRAIYEGLTEWDAKTLHPIPAAAESWEASEDNRTWTFHLRHNALWSNGEKVKAEDFVRSWKRLAEMGEKTPHSELLSNLVGFKQLQKTKVEVETQAKEVITPAEPAKTENSETPQSGENQTVVVQYPETWFGVEAVDEFTLRVWLTEPDADFPKLAAHSALRPVHQKADVAKAETAAKFITNGAFRLASFDKNGAVFERSKNYWNINKVKLERVRFVPAKSEEAALAAYQAGEVDAVTNANFEPLALKLLASYQDFQRSTYNAVTFYEFNQEREHFKDRRVREALTISIDRERLTNDEMDGASVPAYKFLPASERNAFQLDVERARNLLTEAGFPNGKGFPKIKLLINRNETQRRIAKAVAADWKKNLGIETEVVVSSLDELEEKVTAKDFDLVRRVMVLPTTDEKANLLAMFGRKTVKPSAESVENKTPEVLPTPSIGLPIPLPTPDLFEEEAPPPHNSNQNSASSAQTPEAASELTQPDDLADFEETQLIESEAQAIETLPAIPLYFPSSYALVKPYITGFETNLLDAPALKDVEIQTNWQSPNSAGQ
jgi:oligopeptide transport system substrate-binding protein